MAVQRDPGVDNLESFIALLTETLSKVQEAQPELEAQSTALDELQDEAEGSLAGFDGELDADLAAFDALAEEAKDAMQRLEATAATGADGSLEEATDAFGEWEGKLGALLDDAAQRVKDAAEDLDSEGFEEVHDAVTEMVRALEASREATEAGFDAFQRKLEHEGERFAGSLVTASLAAEDAASAAEALETEVEGVATALTASLVESSSSALGDHAATKSQAGAFLDEIESRAHSEAKDVVGEMQEVFRQMADAVRAEDEAAVLSSVASVLTDGLAPFEDEVGEWRTQSDEAAKELGAWDAFVDDLGATLVVVDLIDEVRKAME